MTDKSAMKPRARRAQLPPSEQGKSADQAGYFGQDSAPDARAEAHALTDLFPEFFRISHWDADAVFIQAVVTSADGSRYWHSFALASSDTRPIAVPPFKLGEVSETLIDCARANGIILHIQCDVLGACVRALYAGKSIMEDGPHFALNVARVLIAAKGGRK